MSSLFGYALAGLGDSAVNITNKYIDESLAQQRLQAIADIQRKSTQQQREDADAFNNNPEKLLRDRANKVADITAEGGAKGAVDLQSAINTATNEQLTAALAAREAAAAKAKDENTSRDVMPGGQIMRNGVKVFENTRPTSAEVMDAAYKSGEKGNSGKTTRADHYTDKEWDTVRKVDPSVVTFPDALGGKGVESPELRQMFRTRLTELQQAGSYSPEEASDMARSTTLKLKNAAQDRVEAARAADPKSTLTEQKAVQQLLSEFAARQKPTAAPAAPKVAPAAPVTAAPTSVPLSAQAEASGSNDPTLAGLSLVALSGIADSPRQSAARRAAAKAEIARRGAAVPVDASTDPALYAQ
jgi:hypothetical protein